MGGTEGEVFLFGVLGVLGVVGVIRWIFGAASADASLLAMQWRPPTPDEEEERAPESGVRRKAGAAGGRARGPRTTPRKSGASR